ncbi:MULTISPECIES: hypothetical protein [Bacillus]|uniref:hypothetical protein n=1 Tax=Bacillus TaxID=1386 RepID=UPI0004A5758D|nr:MULTISPECIES: hypothetical protein [Bacillus subtilis group]KFI01423.1 hypothetical protein JN25_19530 [Bacillus sp. BSC154]MCY7829966.1 hypothetical protein [Bacillus spizizenii]MCY7842768.1 hypothetical protein [Bacillus spizizenii]MCY9257387.1 hypothetical protein [Bacillus spizizenii]MCY9315804.1 hypothetical protein [Bacillus spizizenii]
MSNEGKHIYEEYEELKKKTIKVIHRKNYSIRIIDQKFEDDSLDQFYKEVARLLFERALKKKKKN